MTRGESPYERAVREALARERRSAAGRTSARPDRARTAA